MRPYAYSDVEKRSNLKPLAGVDFSAIQPKLDGLLFNIDRDLERHEQRISGDEDARQAMLLHVICRIALNSYRALCFLQSDTDEHPKRRPSFVLIGPPVNRQLIDLLFTIVYMRDDFGPRSLAYEQASWRAFTERYQREHKRFGHLPDWATYFTRYEEQLAVMTGLTGITPEQKADPTKIPRWRGGHNLSRKATASQPFLQWLDEWVYGDVSAQSHVTGTGLFQIAPFLFSDRFPEDQRKLLEERAIHQYRAHYFTQTVLIVLALATEIDAQCKLGNQAQISYIWDVLCKTVPDAKDMFERRYDAMLATPLG